MGDSSTANESLATEIQSVQAIFPDTVIPISDHQIVVNCANEVQLKIHLLSDYPNILPHFELSAPSVNGNTKRKLLAKLDQCSLENKGEPMLYPLIEMAMEEFSGLREEFGMRRITEQGPQLEKVEMEDGSSLPVEFYSGQPIEDRKSVFQAHVAKLTSKDQIPELLAKLKEVGKIARARHNPYAWRLVLPAKNTDAGNASAAAAGQEIEQHDCDDDGEEGSSVKLMRMLSYMKVQDVLVVVSRWKGGGKIGPDRFRHICNAARDALIAGGFVKEKPPLNG